MISSWLPVHPYLNVTLFSCALEANSRNRLLNLPPELRNKIYEYSLYIGEVWLLDEEGLQRKYKKQQQQHTNTTATTLPTPPSVLSLLLTCRQIRDEAEAIFYAINTFNMSLDGPWKFFHAKGPVQRRKQFVEEFTMHYVSARYSSLALDVVFELFAQVARLDNLRTLRVHVRHRVEDEDKDVVDFDKDRARPAINELSKLREFSLSTTAPARDGSKFREIEAEVRTMMDDRDKALGDQDFRRSGAGRARSKMLQE